MQKPVNKFGQSVNVVIHCPGCKDRSECMTKSMGNPCICLNCFGYLNSECCQDCCPAIDKGDKS